MFTAEATPSSRIITTEISVVSSSQSSAKALKRKTEGDKPKPSKKKKKRDAIDDIFGF